MKDMERAVERVAQAVRDGEKIMVYGDYDVDGCTAVALVYKFLRHIDTQPVVLHSRPVHRRLRHLGQRHRSRGAERRLAHHRPRLRNQGMEKVSMRNRKAWISSSATTISRPRCAAGRGRSGPQAGRLHLPVRRAVGLRRRFQAVQALCAAQGIPLRGAHAAAGPAGGDIASDIVPLVDENRILAHYGLIRLSTASLRKDCFRSSRSAVWRTTHHHRRHRFQIGAPHQQPQGACAWTNTTIMPSPSADTRP